MRQDVAIGSDVSGSGDDSNMCVPFVWTYRTRIGRHIWRALTHADHTSDQHPPKSQPPNPHTHIPNVAQLPMAVAPQQQPARPHTD